MLIMSENKNTGVQTPDCLNPEPEFQYSEYDCTCGKIWLEYVYVGNGNFEDYSLRFICCGKKHKTPFKRGVLSKPRGKIVKADLSN